MWPETQLAPPCCCYQAVLTLLHSPALNTSSPQVLPWLPTSPFLCRVLPTRSMMQTQLLTFPWLSLHAVCSPVPTFHIQSADAAILAD